MQTNALKKMPAIPLSREQQFQIVRATGKPFRNQIQRQPETYQLGIAAFLGMTNNAIMKKTGLRKHQVSYRMWRTGASAARQAYRNGEGPIAHLILKKAAPVAEAEFAALMREKMKLDTTLEIKNQVKKRG